MRKVVMIAIVTVVAAGSAAYFGLFSREQAAAAAGAQQGPGGAGRRPGGGGGGGFGPFGGGGGFRTPMTVQYGTVGRGTVSSELTVVGNLIGAQTVDVAPKTGGRLQSVNVKLGDAVGRGQLIAKLEDREIVEQVKQAEASYQVAQATIRQREADLKYAETNLDRSRNLYERQLLPKQSLDDADARYTAAVAQLDLARAQFAQAEARLEELRINLANTEVRSPVNGFVGKRNVDAGAWVSQNAPVASVVEISSLRLVANVVEKDLRYVQAGDPAVVAVDAYPGEEFKGRIARVAPVLDPATRTAEMEIEIPNSDNRLKPGMYARVELQVEEHTNTLVVPKSAVVDYDGQRGLFKASEEQRAVFVPVKIGIEEPDKAEILDGVAEGDRIVVDGAGSLRADDQLIDAAAAAADRPGAGGGQPGQGRRPNGGNRQGGQGPGQGQRPQNPSH
ncbi:MAG: efflux RND transporter periplasmic adaptor subunit [Vicinamibacterales bacterium]